MRAMKRACALLLAALFVFASALPALAGEAVLPTEAELLTSRKERALLIGIDEFVSKPSAYPSSTNNVYAVQEVFQGAATPLEALILPSSPVTSADELAHLIQATFANAAQGDVSYLYISTHGVYVEDGEPRLLLSDGLVEGSVTPAQLEAAFEGIGGTKVIWLDACNSGAFIGKGLSTLADDLCFLGDEFKILTSSGAMEESWYWSDGAEQGGFYFTQTLRQGLSARYGYPADANKDGGVTLTELYDYLLLNHAASTPQVYPQSDDFVVFRYDTSRALPEGLARSPVMDVTFSGTILSASTPEISIEFIAMRPVRVAYQIVYQRDDKWQFNTAQLIYDQAERYTAFGDLPGAVSAGRKVRSLTLNDLGEGGGGYVLAQLVTIEEESLTVHAGRVICVMPASKEIALDVSVPDTYSAEGGRELSVFVEHDAPCALSVAVVDEEDKVLMRLCHRQSTRPTQIEPEGSVLYWNGKLKSGEYAPMGAYRVRVQAVVNDATQTAYSDVFFIE